MPRHIPRKLLGLLLVAIMLATSVIPPGYRHAHEGGNDLSHEHANVVHPFSHQLAGTVCREAAHDSHIFSVSNLENSFEDDKSHQHFQFFGFSVALPDFNHSQKSGKDSTQNRLVSILRTDNYLSLTPSNKVANNWLVLISQDYSPPSAVTISATPNSLQTVTSALLCDQARHERSGVQLI